MKSIERRFKELQKNEGGWSSYVCFFEAIYEQGFSRSIIRRWFNKLVDLDDYAKREKSDIIDFLYKKSIPKKGLRTTRIRGKTMLDCIYLHLFDIDTGKLKQRS